MKFYIDGKHRHSSQIIKALEVEADDREEAISIAIERGVVISWVGRDPEEPPAGLIATGIAPALPSNRSPVRSCSSTRYSPGT